VLGKNLVANAASIAPTPASGKIFQLCDQRIPNGPDDPPALPKKFSGLSTHFGKVSFAGGIAQTKACYQSCNQSKDGCDEKYLNFVENQCQNAYPSNFAMRHKCTEAAGNFKSQHSNDLQSQYDYYQSGNCKCCPEGTQNCGDDICCPADHCCRDGQCKRCVQFYCPCDPNKKPYTDEAICKAECSGHYLKCAFTQCQETN
jgi:hypothetical protein